MMNKISEISLTAMGGGLYTYGVTLFDSDFYKGLILVGVGIITIVGAAILQKHGYPVSKSKGRKK